MGVLERFRLDDQVVLITGAASGIGRAYAETLASDASAYCTGSVFTVDGGWTTT